MRLIAPSCASISFLQLLAAPQRCSRHTGAFHVAPDQFIGVQFRRIAGEEVRSHALRGCDIGLHERGRGRGSKQSGFSGFVRLYRDAVLPPDKCADDRQVCAIEHGASGERRGVKAGRVVNRTSKPASKRHA